LSTFASVAAAEEGLKKRTWPPEECVMTVVRKPTVVRKRSNSRVRRRLARMKKSS
jgi:hypothetical protein